MRLSVTTDDGDFHAIDVSPDIELENVTALLEAECQVPAAEQQLFHNGKPLTDQKKSLAQHGVVNDDIILLRRKASAAGAASAAGENGQGNQFSQQAEALRQQMLSDSVTMEQVRKQDPELARAVTAGGADFERVLMTRQRSRNEAEARRVSEINALNADPFDVEAQRKIEEEIRRERVAENREATWEHHPEAFGNVHMLYINVQVNGVPLKAFVDSGAQSTIMSPTCAEKTGLMRLLDTNFSGIARGVGTAKILGRVHNAPMKVGKSFLPCAFTIIEGKDVDLLFGLDMLKRHQACIDLKNNCLTVHGENVAFLPEHEIPKWGDVMSPGHETAEEAAAAAANAPATVAVSGSAPPGSSSTNASGSAPSSGPASSGTASTSAQKYPEQTIEGLIALGASRAEVIAALDAASGNPDVAAGFLF